MLKFIVLFTFVCAVYADTATDVLYEAEASELVDPPPADTFNSCPDIDTTLGAIRGRTSSCGLFCSYCRYAGIPYAAPPVGDLRFRATVPHPGWDGVRDATEHGNVCPSGNFLGIIGDDGDEDCLYLNVYTKNTAGRLPVMVWIHGGSFSGGSGNSWIYGPDYIIDDGVILVTINYRLGVLGFMSTGDEHAPGNYGLKDMVMALKWVKANIARFGGDPDNVTIFGESAGGAAVHYLLLSPTANGLFTRAISQSGSALNPWAYQTNPLNVAKQLARDLGITFTDTEDLVNQLRDVHPSQLVANTPGALSYPIPRGLLPIPFVPSLDPEGIPESEVFLPRSPMELMMAGSFNQVPYITGFNSDESLFMIRELLLDSSVFPTFNANPHLFIPQRWNIPQGSQQSNLISDEIRNFYFGGQLLANDLRYEYSVYNTDLMFAHGIDQTARIHAQMQPAPVFYYQFSFDGALNMIKTLLFLNDYPGVIHADELFYLFRITNIPPPLLPTNPAITTRRRMVRMWTNFARNGNPTPLLDLVATTRWPRVGGNQEYLHINDTVTSGRFPLHDRMAFWNRLQETYAPILSK